MMYSIMILILEVAVSCDPIALFLVINKSWYEPLLGGSFGQGE